MGIRLRLKIVFNNNVSLINKQFIFIYLYLIMTRGPDEPLSLSIYFIVLILSVTLMGCFFIYTLFYF